MSIAFLVPKITAVQISPNPASINEAVVFLVTITEVAEQLEEENLRAGEIYTGER
nr:MAG TPA: hypothetical protein [Caudoviricetes sp.]